MTGLFTGAGEWQDPTHTAHRRWDIAHLLGSTHHTAPLGLLQKLWGAGWGRLNLVDQPGEKPRYPQVLQQFQAPLVDYTR